MSTHYKGPRGVEEWTQYLKDKDIPIMQASKLILMAMEGDGLETISAKDLVRVVVGDPFLAVGLLRNAEAHRSHRLEREPATPMATIMQTGLNGVLALVRNSQIADGNQRGLSECAFQSATASYLARRWGFTIADQALDEIAMAALLADIGELMLWNFEPDVPIAALVRLKFYPSLKSSQAQEIAAGVSFKNLSLSLANAWGLPPLISMLINGEDNVRAGIARIASNTARHLRRDPENPAVIADIGAVRKYLPGVNLATILAPLPVSDEFKEHIQEALAGPAE